ncbi:MAG: hypothetical protein WCP39_04245, partial [Chlamydiota bacterium]
MRLFRNISMSREEKIFIFCALFCSFFISLEYGITRPACNSLFLTAYSSKIFPYAWLATVPLNFAIVYFYNRLLPSLGCVKTFLIVICSVAGVNTFFALFLHTNYYFPFIQFIWKDVYILLMFKQLWSLTHTMISTEKAKVFYG